MSYRLQDLKDVGGFFQLMCLVSAAQFLCFLDQLLVQGAFVVDVFQDPERRFSPVAAD